MHPLSDLPPDVQHDAEQFYAHAREMLSEIVTGARRDIAYRKSQGQEDHSASFVVLFHFIIAKSVLGDLQDTAMICAAAIFELARQAPRANPLAHMENEEN